MQIRGQCARWLFRYLQLRLDLPELSSGQHLDVGTDLKINLSALFSFFATNNGNFQDYLRAFVFSFCFFAISYILPFAYLDFKPPVNLPSIQAF